MSTSNAAISPIDSGPAISIDGVWKIFGDNAAIALQAIERERLSKAQVLETYNCVIGVANVSLSIERGEIFCIMGLSGSGKSTLVRHINRLLEPTAGGIEVNGRDIMKMNPAELRQYRNQHISMVFQNFALLPHRSVLDNIAMPLEIRGVSKNHRLDKAREILSMVELSGWGNKFAHELSGGMQQRVGLARAIAADSEILLMDEPFSALDPLIRRQLQGEFMRLANVMKKTTVFITHDLDEAVRIGNRIAIMRDGQVVQTGTPEEIIMQPADDYVADFVAGISRLKIVPAHAIMQPYADWQREHGPLPPNATRCRETDNITTLISAAIENDAPLAIVNSHADVSGVINRTQLLRAVVAGTESD